MDILSRSIPQTVRNPWVCETVTHSLIEKDSRGARACYRNSSRNTCRAPRMNPRNRRVVHRNPLIKRPKRRMDSCVILLILAALRCFPFLFLIHRLPESKRSPVNRGTGKRWPVQRKKTKIFHWPSLCSTCKWLSFPEPGRSWIVGELSFYWFLSTNYSVIFWPGW